ncbi:DNA-binding response regulator [Enterobacterales bacterium CwR94]|nr:DNA-binding response regulator [Enterobacterales bacterium CwR94]
MATVLIVDDHPAICFALKVLLEKETALQVVTSSGERLLPLVRELEPDLVVLDIELHNGDGMAALPRIKHAFPAIRVLMLTAQPAPLYALRAQQAGADGFVSKHTPLTAVVSLCQLILDGYQCFPETVLNALHHSAKGSDAASVLARLSDREMAVLRQLRLGKSNKEIADMLALSNKTISTYKTRMLEKSGTDNLDALFSLMDAEGESS